MTNLRAGWRAPQALRRTDVMIPFATTSKTIRLALAMTMLTPLPLLAETLTAREMLAQAQSQAVALPGEAKKPGATEIAKLEVGKPEPTRSQPTKTEPPQVELVPPMPIIVPTAPEKPAPAASAEPVSQQHRPASDNAALTSAPEVPRPSVAVSIAPPAAITAPAPAPAAAPSAVRPAIIAPTPQIGPAVSQSAHAAPPPPVASAAPAQLPHASSPVLQIKTRRGHDAGEAATAPREQKVATRHPRRSRGEPSLGIGGSGINAQMISRIMQRPEVKSLIAQYGVR
jgi:hypothetical protein